VVAAPRVESEQGLTPNIYMAFSARLKVVP
jgi:hypothetical protein